MSAPRYSSRLDSALSFAATAHGEQKRKGTEVPYVVHPVAVAALLASHGWDEDTVIAGLLHDVVEDTETSIESVRALFGDRVADIVAWCSEPAKSLPWEQRKREAIERMQRMPPRAKAVSCADKAHNLNTIADELARGVDVWRRFKRGREAQLDYHRRALEALRREFEHPILEELRLALERVEGGCGSSPR